MFGFLLLAFLVVPILELYVFVQVADSMGFGSTVFWIVAVSVIGAWLVRYEGLSALARANERVARGELPTDELINGILILFAGALMLTPGFLTDTFGLLLLFPPTRAMFRTALRSRFTTGPIVIGGFGGPPSSGTGGVWDADSWEGPADGDTPRELP